MDLSLCLHTWKLESIYMYLHKICHLVCPSSRGSREELNFAPPHHYPLPFNSGPFMLCMHTPLEIFKHFDFMVPEAKEIGFLPDPLVSAAVKFVL